MSDTEKHRKFVNEPMRDKPVEALPGIAGTIGNRLKDKGFDKANQVYGQFLVLRRDETAFADWFYKVGSRNYKHCFNALNTYCDNYF